MASMKDFINKVGTINNKLLNEDIADMGHLDHVALNPDANNSIKPNTKIITNWDLKQNGDKLTVTGKIETQPGEIKGINTSGIREIIIKTGSSTYSLDPKTFKIS